MESGLDEGTLQHHLSLGLEHLRRFFTSASACFVILIVGPGYCSGWEAESIMALFLGNSDQGWNWIKLSYHLPYTTIGGHTELAITMHTACMASALLHEIDIYRIHPASAV